MDPLDPDAYRDLVHRALAEDVGTGDITTDATVTHFHGAMRRSRMKCVSSGMLPYQMTRYWPNVR